MKTKRQFNYTPNFLASAENHCFFCSVDGVGVRKYYKYNYKKLKEFNNFSKISIHHIRIVIHLISNHLSDGVIFLKSC